MAAWDTIYGQLLAVLPAATGLSANVIYDGEPVSDAYPPQFVVVGDDGQGRAGGYTQDFSDVGTLTDESGDIFCRFVAQGGKAAFASLRTAAQAAVAGLRAQITADKRFSVLSEGSYVNVGRAEIAQQQTQRGAVVAVVVTVSYFTRF